MMRHVFGPVPSRRLGRSLGVDVVPFKTCSYDCIYCQLGRTTCKTIDRREWVSLDDVVGQLEPSLATRPDYITPAGSGEPTLANPAAEWTTPALSAMYKGNHTLVTAEWRYIHYADGTEELYNERTDPREWTNVPEKPEYAAVKKKLAKYLPATDAAPVEAKEKPAKKKKRN
jgi:organic radical activating enzyme